MRNSFNSIKSILLFLFLIAVGCGYTPQGLLEKGNALRAQKSLDKAIKNYKKILTKFPKSPESEQALLYLGELYIRELGQMEKGVSYLKELISREKTGENDYRARKSLAHIYDNLLNKCSLSLKERIFIRQNYRSYGEADKNQYAIALCYEKEGDYKKAVEEFQNIVENYRNSIFYENSLYQIANNQYLLGRYSEAIKSYRHLIEERPDTQYFSDSQYGIGLCLEESGDLKGALKEFRSLESTYPNKILVERKVSWIKKLIAQRGRG